MSPKTEVRRRAAGGAEVVAEAKPLRRDAELNLGRILVAARDIFAEYGYEASMEQIAVRAQVGVGTLYRRFPTKADLCAAVLDAATERTRQIAEQVLREVDPGEAVFEFIRRCVDAPSCWRATTSRWPWSGGETDRALATLLPLIGQILESSQQAGTVRADVVQTDLMVTLMSVRAIGDLCDHDAPGASLRFLELTLDGLRPGYQPSGHPTMSAAQLGRVLSER
jgi:AcrR family transcriptional regulator